jgi:hypothetical protein
LTFNFLNLNGFIGWEFLVNNDVISSVAPFGTFGEPKGLEGERLLNDSG